MSKPLHTWKIAVTIPLSVLNTTPSIGMGLPSDSKVGYLYISMGNF